MHYFLLTILFGSLLAISPVSAQTDCPFGLVNEPAPGTCVRYLDGNGNDICDLSELPSGPLTTSDPFGTKAGTLSEEALKKLTVAQLAAQYQVDAAALAVALGKQVAATIKPEDDLQTLHDSAGLCTGVAASIAVSLQTGAPAPTDEELISGRELKTKTVREVAALYNIDPDRFAAALTDYLGKAVTVSDSFQTLHDNYGFEPTVAKDIAAAIAAGTGQAAVSEVIETAATESAQAPARYRFAYISIALLLLFALGSVLVRGKRISLLSYRRFWNLVLLASFLATGLLGVLLVIRINWGWAPYLPFNMLYWHVELGTVMFWVSVFHAVWHWRYFWLMIEAGKVK